jgi:hypothetical protein
MAMPFTQNPAERAPTESSDAPESVAPELDSSEILVALLSEADTDDRDRRRVERYSFPAVAEITPCCGDGAPTEADSHVVRCHNLSKLGISFYWPTMPNFDQVIVALNSPQGTTRLLAHVMFQRSLAGQQGQYLIGCRFVRRANLVSHK